MTTSEARGTRTAFLASVSVLLCLMTFAFAGASLDSARVPSPVASAETDPPSIEPSTSDPKRAAWQTASLVASATDTGRPTPGIPSCEEALDRPTDGRCADYKDALQDFLEEAREACNRPGYARAEDLSCVPVGFFGGLRACSTPRPPRKESTR